MDKITVFTNGCFDILHAGHIDLLEKARALGDRLVVGLNSDASVRALKGPGRPYQNVMSRKRVLGALRVVDEVRLFHTIRCTDLIEEVKPNIYVKAADYSFETLDPSEREALEECETSIIFIPLVGDYSTTRIVKRIIETTI